MSFLKVGPARQGGFSGRVPAHELPLTENRRHGGIACRVRYVTSTKESIWRRDEHLCKRNAISFTSSLSRDSRLPHGAETEKKKKTARPETQSLRLTVPGKHSDSHRILKY